MNQSEPTKNEIGLSLNEVLKMLDNEGLEQALQFNGQMNNATSQTATTISGDPHVVGFNGEEYDFMGDDGLIYNMISTGTVQLNVRMKELFQNRTYINEVGLKVPNYKFRVYLDEESSIQCELNGKPINRAELQETVYFASGLKNKDGSTNMGVAIFDQKERWITINTGSCEFYIYRETEMYDDTVSCPHINISTKVNEIGLLSDGVKPHGFVGLTANHNFPRQCIGDNGKGIVEGEYQDYEVSGLFAEDFKFNAYGANPDVPKVFGFKSGKNTFVIEA